MGDISKTRERITMSDKKIVLFGAGDYGQRALKIYNTSAVEFFVDNDKSKRGKLYCGKKVIHYNDYRSIANKYHTVITTAAFHHIELQLKEIGISDYSVFTPQKGSLFQFYDSDKLILEQFRTEKADHSEEDYNEYTQRVNKEHGRFIKINNTVDKIQNNVPLFQYVEIETINRCNGICNFCPVNKYNDIRKKHIMGEGLFYSIISQLKVLQYSGTLALFSNNEPLLDKRLVSFCKYAKKELPNAYHYLFTNGTLLTLDKFISLIEYLDELIIDNYTSNGKLLKTCEAIHTCVQTERPELIKKVTIVIRNPNEILTTRGGDAPNRTNKASYPDAKCLMPFRQVVIRPDGKLSLCCNDPFGRSTLGDLTKETILEAWHGKKYSAVRKLLSHGRGNYWHCKYCDYFRM